MDQPPPKIIVHPPAYPLTPPTTPDRPPIDHTMLSTPRPSKQERHKEQQVAKTTNAAPDTPQSMPRATGKRDQRTVEETPPHQQHSQPPRNTRHNGSPPPQQTPSPNPADAMFQAHILARRKAARTADSARRRAIRESVHALEMERLEVLTRGWLDNDDRLRLSITRQIRQKEVKGMTFNQLFGPGRKFQEAKVPRFSAGLRARAYDGDGDGGLRLRDALKREYVAPPNFGHPPGEGWLARREWEGFLRRREERWGDPEEIGGVEGDEVVIGGGGGGGGDEEVETD